MLKFKKEYENQTIVLADGTLIDKSSIATDHVQSKLLNAPWFGYMLEAEAPKAPKAEQVEAPKAPKAPKAEQVEAPKAKAPKKPAKK
jgi:hypothetical protein